MSTLKTDRLTAAQDNTNLVMLGSGSGKVVIGDGSLIFPDADGDANQHMKTDGGGNLGWVTASGGTKEFFIPITAHETYASVPPMDELVSTFVHNGIGNNNILYFTFYIPLDFASLTSMVVINIADATETVQWDADTNYGAAGQVHTTHTQQTLNETQAVTNNELEELDVSASFSGVLAGDYIGFKFTSNIDSLRIIGLRCKYA